MPSHHRTSGRRLVQLSCVLLAYLALGAGLPAQAEDFCDWSIDMTSPVIQVQGWPIESFVGVCLGCPYPCTEGTICKTGKDIPYALPQPDCICNCRAYTPQVTESAPSPVPEPTLARKPICNEAMLRVLVIDGEPILPGQLGMSTMDFADLRDQFSKAIDTYNTQHPAGNANLGPQQDGMVGLMSWLSNQGGVDTAFGTDAISKQFVFTTDADRGGGKRAQQAADAQHARWGTERRLLAEMYRFRDDTKRKLTPGDVFYLALEQRGGNAKEAALLAHNTLRSLARENDNELTDVHYDLNAVDALFVPVVAGEPLGRGQKAGSLYHIFTMLTMEMHSRSNLSVIGILNYPYTATADAIREISQHLARALAKDPKIELPETISLISIWSNEAEQLYRGLLTSSPEDIDKWCYNVIGAQLGAWMHRTLPGVASPPAGPTWAPIGTPQTIPHVVQQLFSPANITWEGNGYRMSFDQATGNFSGHYPLLILPYYEAETDTWGMGWIDLLGQPMQVTLEGTRAGWGHLTSLDGRGTRPVRHCASPCCR
ncbi:MAG: hypothetical protein EOM92_12320 [Gammaproteobacteria bacterium]|nr:hypothetical protein [Gammaproteobacteria bacterium]